MAPIMLRRDDENAEERQNHIDICSRIFADIYQRKDRFWKLSLSGVVILLSAAGACFVWGHAVYTHEQELQDQRIQIIEARMAKEEELERKLDDTNPKLDTFNERAAVLAAEMHALERKLP